MRLKYVRHSIAGVVVWTADTELYHAHIAELASRRTGGQVISAGFCTLDAPRCFGKSESLRIGSTPEDSAILALALGLPPAPKAERVIVLREAATIEACDAYFAARPALDTPEARALFEAAFARGFNHPQGARS